MTGLRVKSNTTIRCLPGAGFYLKTGSNNRLIQNANPTRTSADVVDENIQLIGGTYNGNRAGQTVNGVKLNPDGNPGSVIAFWGTRNVTCQGVAVLNQACFGIHFATSSYITLRDCDVTADVAQVVSDCFHFNGPCDHIYARNCSGYNGDDVFAINADDGTDDLLISNAAGPYIGRGDITDVDAEIELRDSKFGFRTLARYSRIERVRVRITGQCRNYFALVDSILDNSGNVLAPGHGSTIYNNHGSIEIDADVTCHDASDFETFDFGGLVVRTNVEHLKARIMRDEWTDTRLAAAIYAAVVDQFDLDLRVHDVANVNPTNQFGTSGHVKNMRVSSNWFAPSATGRLVESSTGQIDHLDASSLVIPSGATLIASGSVITKQTGDAAPQYGESVLASSLTLSGSNDAYQSIGLSVSLPGPGTWRLDFAIRGDLILGALSSFSQGYIVAKLRDITNGADLANSEVLVNFLQMTSNPAYENRTGFGTITTTAAATVALYVKRGWADTTLATSAVNSDAFGWTKLAYRRIG